MAKQKVDQEPVVRSIFKLIATFFYIGEVPFAPGTAASFAGLLLYISLSGNPFAGSVVFAILLIFGFISSSAAERIFSRKDPPQVVIDEVCGIFIVFFGVPLHIISIILGFLVYRIFDIIKPPPAKVLERLKGGYGIMLDDLLCGFYANLILRILMKANILY